MVLPYVLAAGIAGDKSRKCNLCGLKKNVIVEHCHVHGLVRGLTCSSCNQHLAALDAGKRRPTEKEIFYLDNCPDCRQARHIDDPITSTRMLETFSLASQQVAEIMRILGIEAITPNLISAQFDAGEELATAVYWTARRLTKNTMSTRRRQRQAIARLNVKDDWFKGAPAGSVAVENDIDTDDSIWLTNIEAQRRDFRADLAAVMRGEARLRTEVVRQRLAELCPTVYEGQSAKDLSAALTGLGVTPRKSQGLMYVAAEDLPAALEAGEEEQCDTAKRNVTRKDLIIQILVEATQPLASTEVLAALRILGDEVKNEVAMYNLLGKMTSDGVIKKNEDRLFSLSV